MLGSFFGMLFFALQTKYEEDVTRFFPDTEDAKNTEIVFHNLKVKDKIVLMISTRDTTGTFVPPERLIEVGERIKGALTDQVGEEYIQDILAEIDGDIVGEVTDFIYNYLPVFLTEADYVRIDSLSTEEEIDSHMQNNFRNLLLPMSGVMKSIIPRDPLGMGVQTLERLQGLQLTADYALYNNHIFSKDMSTMVLFITPRYQTGSTGKNEFLINAIEQQIEETATVYPDVEVQFFGGPSISVYNARQIKKDTVLTLSIAFVLIVLFITLVFKSRSAIILILLPVLYGAVFSLAAIYFIKGSISAIAIGAGAAIFGVALSYSIHVLSHFNHVLSVRQLIDELSYPLTIGSFTTVGAFFGLIFTNSDLLRDFGLFSALALIGTTLFCLVFLPHLLRIKEVKKESGRVLRLIEKINGYAYEKNKPLVIGLMLVFIVCLFFSGKVTFDNNMMHLSFEPPKIKTAEEQLMRLFQSDDNKTVLLVSTGKTSDEGLKTYRETNQHLATLKEAGKIKEFASAENILVPMEIQRERIKRWNTYWTPERKTQIKERIRESARKYRFKEDTFDHFSDILDRSYKVTDFAEAHPSLRLLDGWTAKADSLSMFITQIRISDNAKEEVYSKLMNDRRLVIFDRGYFANKWVSAINDDFYLILYICSFLIFFALLISYGRLELTLMTFAPMAISWVIILGIMALLGIQFNIVNIILATFIFGLGDDFSIFIMDGLQQEYRTGKRLLASHKTAIFFSSFTAIVGLGALVFAKHPALQSISVISILGMISVVLVSYTALPILFRFFISNPASKRNFPYTIPGLLRTFWFFNTFAMGCSLVMAVASILILLPVRRNKKKEWFSFSIMYLLRGFLKMSWVTKRMVENPEGETFKKPAVIIANHQSFVDILVMLSLAPKLVMVTNSWVWNSPVFGRIVRYADFVQTSEGYEIVLRRLREKVALGYSVVIFPEGTRSADCKIHRFHKGAFYIAEQLQLDILPVVLYGTGMIISKRQPFYVKQGTLCTRILPRISYANTRLGATYQERTKAITSIFRKAYKETYERYTTPDNTYFYLNLIMNYIYKGPVEEWYIRIKVKMENKYTYFHQLIPLHASITDIGCGFGPLDYMLSMLSEERKILGIDYDEDKVAVANHNFSRTGKIRFVCANVLTYDFPESDVFVLNDVLHYMNYASQEQLIGKCIEKLQPGGLIIIRDGDPTRKKQHGLTRFTELLSTRLFEFNKRENDLYFPSHKQFVCIAEEYGMEIEQQANDRFTSNTIYILRKKDR
jgi:1-acyl-sn-glycerol-3-phosphate acyltransferase